MHMHMHMRASARPPEPAERKACSRFRPHTLVPEKELLDLPEFTSKNEFLHQAQRRFTTVVHNRNWRALALELRQEGSARSALPCRGRRKTGEVRQGAGQGQGAGEASLVCRHWHYSLL
mmetsp:Transcript_35456/g.118571  ORF Transcript_35456/g.118571 Transcript_35456/m.118571 type:complete len:119 (-) Transcript_35456:161-517(-)